MKLFFESFAVAFSMYSRIPMPQFRWNERNMRWSLAFFPFVGAVVAAILFGVFLFFRTFALNPGFFAAAAVLVPILMTGGIHIDGYCDTCDAFASHGDRETKLRIMKDPHVGAFGVVYTAALLLLQFGAWQQLFLKPAFIFPVLSASVLARSLAGVAILCFPKAKEDGLAATFAGPAFKKPVTVILLVIAALAALLPAIGQGTAALLAPTIALLSFGMFYAMAKKCFGGITGDLAGFFITVYETLALFTCAILGAVLR